MQKIGIYQEGKRLKVAALSGSKEPIIERLDKPKHFTPEDWPGITVSGIPGEKVLVRHISSPLKRGGALKKTLPFQLEALIPYSLDEVAVAPIYQKGKKGTEAAFFIVSEEALKVHIKEQAAEPSWVSCVPMALYRFARFTGLKEENFVVFHFGSKASEIISVHDGIIQHNISIKIGLEHLEAASQADCSDKDLQLNLSQLDETEHPHLAAILKDFKRDVDRAFYFLWQKQNENKSKYLLFTGETDTKFQIEAYIAQLESFEFEVIPVQDQGGYAASFLKSFAVPIGLALDALHDDKKSIQFCQGKWMAPKVYSRIKKEAIKIAAASLICALFLFIGGHFIYQKKEKGFLQKIDAFVSHYVNEIPEIQKTAQYTTSEEKIQFLDRKIKAVKRDFHYFSTPPLAADFLAFLSAHPKLNRSEGEKKIEINHVKYELVQYPSVQEPFQSYKIKIDLIFTSPESAWAREFHDAIIEDAEWIDGEEKVTWDRNQNVYTLSFFFKAS